jgi:hypothetical protein
MGWRVGDRHHRPLFLWASHVKQSYLPLLPLALRTAPLVPTNPAWSLIFVPMPLDCLTLPWWCPTVHLYSPKRSLTLPRPRTSVPLVLPRAIDACTAPCTDDACHSCRLLLMSSRNNRLCHHYTRSQVVTARTTHAMEEGEAVSLTVEGEAWLRAWLPKTCCLELNARRCQGRTRDGWRRQFRGTEVT